MFQQCVIYIQNKFGASAEATSVIEIDGGKIISYHHPERIGIQEETISDLEWNEWWQNHKLTEKENE